MAKTQRSLRLHLGKVAIFNILTFGLYNTYLFFNNIKFLQEYSKEKASKWLIALWFVPIGNLVMYYLLVSKTGKTLKWENTKITRIFVAFLIPSILGRLTDLMPEDLPLVISLLPLVAYVAIIVIVTVYYQKQINDFLVKKETNQKYKVVYPWEIGMLIAGILVIFLIIILLMIAMVLTGEIII